MSLRIILTIHKESIVLKIPPLAHERHSSTFHILMVFFFNKEGAQWVLLTAESWLAPFCCIIGTHPEVSSKALEVQTRCKHQDKTLAS